MNLKKKRSSSPRFWGAALLYLFRVEIPKEIELSKKDIAFRDLSAGKVEAVEIKRSAGNYVLKNLELAADDVPPENSADLKYFRKWEVNGIPGSRLEASHLNSLFTALKDLKLDDALPKEDLESDLTVYGLKDPALSIKLTGPSLNKEIAFGKKNDYLGKRYMKVGDAADIYLANDNVFSAADKSADDFRDKTPLEFSDYDLRLISLKSAAGKVDLEKKDEVWNITAPIAAPADSKAAPELTRHLRNLQAARFIDDNSKIKEFGLDQPKLEIRLEFNKPENNPAVELLLSKVGDKTYLYPRNGNTIYELSADPFNDLDKKPDDLRDRRVFVFSGESVRKAVLEDDSGTKLEVTRTDTGWKVNGKEGDKIFVDQWIGNIGQTEAAAFAAKKEDYGFAKPKAKLTLEITDATDKNKTVPRILTIGKMNGAKQYFAAADDLKVPVIISEETFKKITVKEEALLPQKVSESAPAPKNTAAE